MSNENYIVKPKLSCGPYRFGMSQTDIENITNEDSTDCFKFNKDGLYLIELYSEPEQLFFQGTDILSLSCLDAALFVAKHSQNYGQAQGGSLYFDDLGIAILQYENLIARTFVFYCAPHSEPLRTIDADGIRGYYNDQF